MTIRTFEDINAWQVSRELNKKIYLVTRSNEFDRDWDLRRQMRRSSISTMSNIAEGFERNGNREFIQFLSTAKGSVGELRAQIYAAFDTGFLQRPMFLDLKADAERTSQIIAGFVRYLSRSDLKGWKYT